MFLLASVLLGSMSLGFSLGDSGMGICSLLSVPSVAALALATTVACADTRASTGSNPYIEKLAQALGDRRLFEPRLSGDFAWAPCQQPKDSGDLIPAAQCSGFPEFGSQDYKRLVEAWKEIIQGPGNGQTAELLHAEGVGHLVWSAQSEEERGHQLDSAVESLEQALKRVPEESPQRPAILNDLAATLLVRAAARDRALDLMEALDFVETAFELAPASTIVAFNRGLARSGWSLREQGKAAWDDFLALESGSDWSREALNRRQALGAPTRVEGWTALRPGLDELAKSAVLNGGSLDFHDAETVAAIAKELPLFSRGYAQNVALAAWADAYLDGDQDAAARWLALSHAIGEALVAQRVDSMVADAVATIDESQALPERVDRLARGHSAYGQGYRREKGWEAGNACESYRASEGPLRELGTPFEMWPALSLAMSCLQLTDLPAAERAYSSLESRLDPERYPALAGRVAWMLSMADGRQGRVEAAYQRAFDAFNWMQRAADADVASVLSLLGGFARTLGLYEEAWSHHLIGLRSQAGLGNPPGLFTSLMPVARDLLDDRRPKAAEPFIAEMEAAAESIPLRIYGVYAASYRARLEALEQHEEEARAALALARQRVAEVGDGGTRRRIEADLDREEGRLALSSAPVTAVKHLSSALAAYGSIGDLGTVPEVYLLRASAHMESGETENAEKDFEQALVEMERRREEPSDESLRISFFETFQDALDRMLRVRAVDRGDSAGAFELAERARGRALLDWAGSTWPTELYDPEVLGTAYPKPIGLDELRATLPADLTLIEYAVLPDELLIWVVRQKGSWFRREPVAQQDLAETVARFRQLMEHGAGKEAVQGLAGQLFDHLVRPVEDLLPPKDASIVVVPDRFLHRVPWAALWDSQAETWWVERHALAVSASASMLAASLARDRDPRAEARGSALILADPEIDAKAYPGLPPLPGAAAEGRAVAELYPGARLLLGAKATARAFLEEAPHYKVVHIAAHAQYLDEAPALSSLLLAGTGDGDDGALRAYELYGLDLSSVEIVVLSACRTVDGFPQAGREGVAGWARAFLAAGAPRIVASLWNVEDGSTARLMIEFHRRLGLGEAPVSAFREAQLELLRSRDQRSSSSGQWALFQVYGF